MRPWRWRESIRESSVRTSTRFRYPVRRRSGESFGSNFESYVPSTSTMRRRLSSVALSPPSIRVAPDHLLGEELAGPVGRAHEGPGGHVGEAHRLSGLAEAVEGLGRHELLDREVPSARTQVLAEGHDVHAGCTEIPHRLEHLRAGLAEAEHQGRLREEAGLHRLRPPEHVKALRIVRAAVPYGRLPSFHRLEVVVEHVHPRVDDRSDSVEVSVEIRGDRLDEHVGPGGLGLCETLRQMGR